jgi:serpin B
MLPTRSNRFVTCLVLAGAAVACGRGGEGSDANTPSLDAKANANANAKSGASPANADAPKSANVNGVTETQSANGKATTKETEPASGAGSDLASGAPGSGNGAGGASDPSNASANVDAAEVRAANAFGFKLYRKTKRGAGNQLVSGTSLRSALGVAYLGARGATAREMASALDLPADASKAAEGAKADRAAWQAARGKAELVVANRVWTEKTFALDARFTAMAEGAFGAAPEPVDFKTAPEAARRTINTWVASSTGDKIVDLLPAGSVDAQSRVVVTNAIYFKGRWALPFPASATKDEPWRLGGAKTKTTPMMHTTESQRFAQLTGAVPLRLLELRYEGSEMAMLLVLPEDPANLGKLEDALTTDAYEAWTKQLAHQRVAITLPKFSFKSGGPMAAPLRELGMKAAFTTNAELGGIAEPKGGEKLQLSQVVQQTYVAVDENGTEAAAASGVVMRTTSMPMGQPAEFKADHPFLFFIVEKPTGLVLFMGRVADPATK